MWSSIRSTAQDRQDHPARRPREQDQSHLSLGGRRAGQDRRGARQFRSAHQGADLVPALPSGAARTVRHRRRHEHGHRTADAVHHLAGAARAPHRRLARDRHPRRQDPHHLAGYRRRLRQQGSGLSGLRRRDGRIGHLGRTGEVDRDAHRKPHHHRLRARLPHGRGDRREQRRQAHRAQGHDGRRPRRVRRRGRSDEISGRPVRHRDRLVRLPDGLHRTRRLLHQQGTGRHRLPLLVPRDRGIVRDRARHGYPGATSWTWTPPSCG